MSVTKVDSNIIRIARTCGYTVAGTVYNQEGVLCLKLKVGHDHDRGALCAMLKAAGFHGTSSKDHAIVQLG